MHQAQQKAWTTWTHKRDPDTTIGVPSDVRIATLKIGGKPQGKPYLFRDGHSPLICLKTVPVRLQNGKVEQYFDSKTLLEHYDPPS